MVAGAMVRRKSSLAESLQVAADDADADAPDWRCGVLRPKLLA
jgi:hypothetical protein